IDGKYTSLIYMQELPGEVVKVFRTIVEDYIDEDNDKDYHLVNQMWKPLQNSYLNILDLETDNGAIGTIDINKTYQIDEFYWDNNELVFEESED
ncbi:23200_t:CDS:2, partial [Racocetra persica]